MCLCMCVLSSVSAVPLPPNRVCPCVHTMKVELLKACLKRDAPLCGQCLVRCIESPLSHSFILLHNGPGHLKHNSR